MKILYFSPGWTGSTSVQRYRAMAAMPGVTVVHVDSGANISQKRTLAERAFWKLGWPIDSLSENARLLEATRKHQPDWVFVEASRVLLPKTLRTLRASSGCSLAFYTPDDSIRPHNLSIPMRLCFPLWDVFFTTKSFNVAELRERGVRNPKLIGKAFDPLLHRPLTQAEVGERFESFDCVFVGTFEQERANSLHALAEAGISVGIFGNGWRGATTLHAHPRIQIAPAANEQDFGKAMHTGKLALNFLRKINRDHITQRSMEIPAMQRVMIAEKTPEHDASFVDGAEYVGFSSDEDLVRKVRMLLANPELRHRIAAAGRARCLEAGYSTNHRAAEMLATLHALRGHDVKVSA